jgi:hypothetical protein
MSQKSSHSSSDQAGLHKYFAREGSQASKRALDDATNRSSTPNTKRRTERAAASQKSSAIDLTTDDVDDTYAVAPTTTAQRGSRDGASASAPTFPRDAFFRSPSPTQPRNSTGAVAATDAIDEEMAWALRESAALAASVAAKVAAAPPLSASSALAALSNLVATPAVVDKGASIDLLAPKSMPIDIAADDDPSEVRAATMSASTLDALTRPTTAVTTTKPITTYTASTQTAPRAMLFTPFSASSSSSSSSLLAAPPPQLRQLSAMSVTPMLSAGASRAAVVALAANMARTKRPKTAARSVDLVNGGGGGGGGKRKAAASVPAQSSAEAAAIIFNDMRLAPEQRQVMRVVARGENIFFTGAAGTGKSFLLRVAIDGLRAQHGDDAVAVTASTGAAACNIGGTTLHAFAGCGLADKPVGALVAMVHRNRQAKARWDRTEVLVCDEIR